MGSGNHNWGVLTLPLVRYDIRALSGVRDRDCSAPSLTGSPHRHRTGIKAHNAKQMPQAGLYATLTKPTSLPLLALYADRL